MAWIFLRVRISVRGQIIEDTQDFTRVSHMFKMFENAEPRLNDLCEGFGYFDEIDPLEDIGGLPGIKSGS